MPHVKSLAAALTLSGLLCVWGCSGSPPPAEQAPGEKQEDAASSPAAQPETDAPAGTTDAAAADADQAEPSEPGDATESVAPAKDEAPPAVTTPELPSSADADRPAADGEAAPVDLNAPPVALDAEEAGATTMPGVHLSEAHAEASRLKVGDQLPDVALADLAGEQRQLHGLLGPKLTVVYFWKASKPTAVEQLGDMRADVAERFGVNGVRVVGINVGDDVQLAAKLADQLGATHPQLSDADGAALAQAASGHLPRTYLVDPNGKILWFDLEYSQTTRRDLQDAIRYLLTHES